MLGRIILFLLSHPVSILTIPSACNTQALEEMKTHLGRTHTQTHTLETRVDPSADQAGSTI